jgi:hypothetical protein
MDRVAIKRSDWRGGRLTTPVIVLAMGALGVFAIPTVATAGKVAVLQGLNKVTAQVSTIEAPVNETAEFGKLKILARTCHKAPPEEPPESTALLIIEEVKPERGTEKLFAGWMFASSPALSALEHPVYDIWVVDCRDDSPAVAPNSSAE